MVVAETLAGIALVRASVEAIKSAITTAKDIGGLASHIDNLFDGEKQVQKSRNEAQSDPFSMKSVAHETINAKLAQEQMDEMRQLLDFRFGHGTFQSIVVERARRIQEQKEKAKEERIRRKKEYDANMKTFSMSLGIFFGAIIILGVAYFLLVGVD